MAVCVLLVAEATGAPPPAQAASASPNIAPEERATPPADPRAELDPADEVVAERTETSRTFDLGDGRYATELFTEPVFYQPAGSTDWQPIEVGFATEAGLTDGRVAVSDRSPVAISVGAPDAAEGFLALERDGQRIDFHTPPGVDRAEAPSDPVVADGIADFAELLPGVGLRVIPGAFGAKSFFVWDAPPKVPSIQYVVDAPGLTLSPADDGSIGLVDAKGTLIAEIPRPYAVDSTPDALAGGGRYSDAVTLELGEDGRTVTVAVDPAWLADAVYPVYVDPSTGWVYNTGSNSYGDAHTASAYPSSNFDDYVRPDNPWYHELWNGIDPSGAAGTTYSWLRWDTSALGGVVIDEATLALWPYHQYYNPPTTATTYVRRATGSWTEGAITWSNQPASPVDPVSAGCVEAAWCYWNVTDIVQKWRNGVATNYGFRVDTYPHGSTHWKRFIASEQGVLNGPRLTITYHTPVIPTWPTGGGKTGSTSSSWTNEGPWTTQTAFVLDVATNSAFTQNLVTSGTVYTSATSWAIPGTLTPGTTYYWRVKVREGANSTWSAYSDTASFVADPTVNLGQQSQHTFETWDLGAGDELAVNVGTGNLVLRHPIVSLPIRGSSVDIDLTYNRHDTSDVGMGPGWRLILLRRLTINADGSVTFADADGARHTFTNPVVNGTVTTYTRPASLYATLVKDTSIGANEFVLTYRDQSKDKFDISGSSGLLVREEDRFGNGVTLAYSSGLLSSISDAAGGRSISVAWTSGKLTAITDWANVSGGVVQASGSGNRVHRFFYSGGALIGWADPLNTTGSCPTGGSHLTCLNFPTNQVNIVKTQTVTTIGGSPAALGTLTRPITTRVTFVGSDVVNVKDAEEVYASGDGTVFSHPVAGQTQVIRQGSGSASLDTTTRYSLVAAADAHARIGSTMRKLGSTWIERLTAYNATYPIEPASITDNQGTLLSTPARTVSYTYVASSMGLVSRTVEPLDGSYSRWTDYTYNANNDVTQTIVSRQGDATLRTTARNCYTTSGCATNATDLFLRSTIENYKDGTAGGTNGHVEDVTTSYLYDAYGQPFKETRSNYAPGGALLDTRALRTVFDDKGHLTKSIANYVDGVVTSPGDDIAPNATTGARTDLTTTYTYDTAGNQISAADPRRAIEAALGTNLAVDDFISRSTYDALNQRLTDKTPTTPGITITQKTASTAYDEFGLIRSATDFGGLVSASEHDRAGRGTRTFEDPDGAGSTAAAVTSQATYDPSGRTLTAKDQLQVATASLGGTATTYDELGRAIDVIEASGSSPNVASTTRSGYDALDRVVSSEVGYPSGQSTIYAYDLGGRTTKTDDEFACTTATFDYRDLQLTETSGLVGGTCASGAATRTVSHTYDGMARLTRSEVTAGAGTGDRTVDATLDAMGRTLTSGVRTGGVTSTTTFTFNPLDQVLGEARADGSTAKTSFDPAGNAADRCYWKPGITVGACLPEGTTPWTNPPSQVTTTTSDARNQRIELRDSATATISTYDPDHNYQPAAFYVPTGTGREHQTLYGYDGEHRLTSITQQLCVISSGHACSSTSPTGSDTYAYDDNDNRTQVVEYNGATNSDRRYCYDALNRLIYRNTGAACSGAAKDESYTYDAAGNRLTAPGQTFTYNAAGQLTGCTTNCSTITYDSAGNTARLKGWSYEYDSEGRLVRACKAASCTGSIDKVEFAHDGEGHRTQTKEYTAGVLTTTRDFRYQGDAIVEESTNGSVSRGYLVDEAGRIIRVCDPSCASPTTSYLVTWNGHGDATALYRINADGTLTLANSYTYSTWGEPTTTTHPGFADLGFRFLYVGAHDVQWDTFSGLGLLYMHARHYSPLNGRFLQPDPSAAEANLYSYAGNSPVTMVDPDGTEKKRASTARLGYIIYRVSTVPDWLPGLVTVASGAVCWRTTYKAKAPWWAELAAAIGCTLLGSRVTPRAGDRTIYSVRRVAGVLIEEFRYYERLSTGRYVLTGRLKRVYRDTTTCRNYLSYNTGMIFLYRMPQSMYCGPKYI